MSFQDGVCEIPWHKGDRKFYSGMKIFYLNKERFEGCSECLRGVNPSTISTQKRYRFSPTTGKGFNISPAHVWDIKHRRLAPDGVEVYRDVGRKSITLK